MLASRGDVRRAGNFGLAPPGVVNYPPRRFSRPELPRRILRAPAYLDHSHPVAIVANVPKLEGKESQS
jgi:hypothetical protein